MLVLKPSQIVGETDWSSTMAKKDLVRNLQLMKEIRDVHSPFQKRESENQKGLAYFGSHTDIRMCLCCV